MCQTFSNLFGAVDSSGTDIGIALGDRGTQPLQFLRFFLHQQAETVAHDLACMRVLSGGNLRIDVRFQLRGREMFFVPMGL